MRRAVAVHRGLGALGLDKHPDKTFIGRIARGFDFLGDHFGPDELTVAAATLGKFVARATRLDEHGPGEPEGSARLGGYVRRWVRWVRAGLRDRGGGLDDHPPLPTARPGRLGC